MAKKKQKTAANDLSSLFEKLGVQIPRNSGKIYDEDLKTYIPAFLKEENSPMNIKTFNEINKRLDEFSLFSTYIPDANFVEKKEEKVWSTGDMSLIYIRINLQNTRKLNQNRRVISKR